MIIFIWVLAAVIIIWLVGIVRIHDFSIPVLNLSQFKKVLVIFPHPDDEVLTVGGLVGMLKNHGIQTFLITLTKGERGTPTAKLLSKLKVTRRNELLKSARILGFNQVTIEDFGDGQLDNKTNKLTQYLQKQIKNINPDAIFSYDLSGLYGHHDHITASKAIKDLLDKKYPKVKLLFASQPQKMMRFTHFPAFMAKDLSFSKHQTIPNQKVYIGPKVINKIRALYAHQSQLLGFRKSMPKYLPLWFCVSLSIFEYFHEVNQKREN